ncbi:MAG TPA: phosphoribosyltransferase [Stellaceae bacterium]|nr:phosphoribosyltransferase [Stellaceae bacterium]
MAFRDRSDAGRRLAVELARFKDAHPVVLALPRGGVPVGFEIAEKLEAPLDVVLVRKIGAPGFEELAIGAIAEGTPVEQVIDPETVAQLDVPQDYLDRAIDRQKHEIERRRLAYRGDRPPLEVRGCCAIVVDDGIATGATMRAALRAVRRRHPERLVMAVPVAPPDALEALRTEADELVCLESPEAFAAVGQFYAEFHQLRDEEVTDLLNRAAARWRPASGEPPQ